MNKLSRLYRYAVNDEHFNITPLASTILYLGTSSIKIRNISEGGLAFKLPADHKFQINDFLDASVSIQDRAFPVQLEIRGLSGDHAHCEFVSPSRLFQSALREYLRPKFIGETFVLNPDLSGHQEILDLVENAQAYEVYLGQNQSGSFVWTGLDRSLLRMLLISRSHVFEWSLESGLRTGRRLSEKEQGDNATALMDLESGVHWDRSPEAAVVNYFADILLAWLKPRGGDSFVESVLRDAVGATTPLHFPAVPA